MKETLRRILYSIYKYDIVRFLTVVFIFPMPHRDDRRQVKGFPSKSNMIFKLKHVKVFVESSVIKVTACRNGNVCIEGRRICYLTPV